MRTQKAERRGGFLGAGSQAAVSPQSGAVDLEARLAASEKRFEDFAGIVSDWIWETGPNLCFTYLSDRFEQATGLKRDKVLDRTLLDVANADLRDPHWQRHLEDFLARRPVRNFRFSGTLANGDIRHFQVSGNPFFDEAGHFQGYRGTGRDVTESERTHEDLHTVKARLEHLLNTSPAMIYSFKAGGNHAATFASNNIKTQLGHEPHEFLDDPGFWSHHIHPDDADRVFNDLVTLFKTGRHVQEYRFRHKDGTYRWMRDEMVLVEDNDGTPLEAVGYWVDITDRKMAEEEVRRYAEKLERSNRELQDFAYVASHDLQEPLRKIEAFGDRLKAKCADTVGEDGRLYLDRMQNAAARMRALINSLLAYSRVTTKAQPFVPVDMAEVATDAVSDLSVRIERAGAKVEVGPMLTIDADPMQMRQLLLNLIGNGLKFHAEGAVPQVRITSKLCDRDGSGPAPADPNEVWCQISIADNGIGFEEKYVDRIFTMFQRLHGRGEYEGTGIGLATCRKIVERHGGSITAKSAPGQGATFFVLVPVRQRNKE